ncbi:hypothetical protein [Alkalihalobacterium bogoriense]|uniref:hypothetical protein n=1 Tax=Alkalihalobacterium bogoriense TaxID=246272 RepID=UPI0012EC79DB|nr:hypothetical protein [Alkalihalobacterium bogoriense]
MVRDFGLMDGGDLMTPPMFSCETCGGEMYPEYYKWVPGIDYMLSDLQETKKD